MCYARSDVSGADALLSEVVARHPQYQPALWRLAEIRRIAGHFADAVMYGEQALKLDPLAEWTRLSLINSYADLGDIAAARAGRRRGAPPAADRAYTIARARWRLAPCCRSVLCRHG